MDNRINQLKQNYINAEEKQRAAYRRAVWLERRLFNATDESEYNTISADLEKQERDLRELGLIATQARIEYVTATMTL